MSVCTKARSSSEAREILHEKRHRSSRDPRRACAGCGTRCCRAPKSSMAMRQAEILHGGATKAAGCRRCSWIAAVSVISTVSRSATPAWRAQHRAERGPHQSGSTVESADTLRLAFRPGRGDQLLQGELEARGDRGGAPVRDSPASGTTSCTGSGGAVGALHPHQAFVECRLARAGRDDRLVDQGDSPRVERADDLLGRNARFSRRCASRSRFRPIGPGTSRGVSPWRRRVRPARGTAFPASWRAWRGPVTPPIVTVTATGPAAVCTTSSRTPASRRSAAVSMSSGVQLFRMMPNLVPEKTPEMVLAAHLAADAPGDLRDHLVRGVEAVGLVDAGEIVDRHQHEAARGAQLDGFIDGRFEHLGHMPAIHLAGQRVEGARDRRAAPRAHGVRR